MAEARFEICHARCPFPGARPGFLWRLLSSNNIEMGRATAALEDMEACLRRIRRVAEGTNWWAVVDGGRGRWTWRMRSGHTDLAMSSRPYPRRVQAERAFHRFLELAVSPNMAVVIRRSPDRLSTAVTSDASVLRNRVRPDRAV